MVGRVWLWASLLSLCLASGGGGGGGGAVEADDPEADLLLLGDVLKFYGRRHVYVQEGQSVSVDCKARLDQANSKLHWEKANGSVTLYPVSKEMGIKEPISGALRISSAKPKDSGKYICSSSTHSTWNKPSFNLTVGSKLVKITSSMDEIKETEEGEHQHLVLSCSMSRAPEDQVIKWYHDGVELGKEGGGNTVKVHPNGTLEVRYVSALHSGIYACKFVREDDVDLWGWTGIKGPGYVHQRHHSSKNMMQEETVSLTCEAYGYPIPKVTWHTNMGVECEEENAKECDISIVKRNETVPMGRFQISSHRGVPGAKLTITRLEFDDRAQYYCCAENEIETEERSCEFQTVRVKDKLAALWPFLGIVAEVAIVVAIIFIYEKRKAAKEAAADEPQTDQKRALTSDSDVRLRSVKA